MSKIYDNWEKLVGAVVSKEKDRQLAYCESFNSSSSVDLSSRFSFEIPFAEVPQISGQKLDGADLSSQNIFFSRDLMVMKFKEIKKATRNFRPGNLVGEGSLGGCVYKGWISERYAAVSPGSGIAVAIKLLNNTTNLILQEWVDEINNLSQLRHLNLLTPIGYSFDTDKRILVYEFMPRGSLDKHLFTRGQQPLPWATRIKVAMGAARGLAFLHDLAAPVTYQILTSDDILLDADFNAKLSDFGIAKDVFKYGDKHEIERPWGVITPVEDKYGPYAAPEFVNTGGRRSTKCDVHSFGVVLLELISGHRVGKERKEWKYESIMNMVGKRKLSRIRDSRLEGEYPPKEVIGSAQSKSSPSIELGPDGYKLSTSEIRRRNPTLGTRESDPDIDLDMYIWKQDMYRIQQGLGHN